jgi:hypothetical protein
MRTIARIVIVLLMILSVAGLILPGIYKVREAAARMSCSNNLKQLTLGLSNYQDYYSQYPMATVPDTDLPPEKRLSWVVDIYPSFVQSSPRVLFDRTKPWDAEVNHNPQYESTVKVPRGGEVGTVRVLVCPANEVPIGPELSPMHYPGIAGVGEKAASLPLTDPRAGFFGHERKITLDDLTDGTAMTLMLMEAADGGPWTAGGPGTVRGLVPGSGPYLGEGGQFTSNHVKINAALADGSVRPFSSSVSPRVIEALATIAGGEKVKPGDFE